MWISAYLFGLSFSPFLFNRLADAFEWILKKNYAIQALMHYLDDYFTVGPPVSPVCASQVHTIVKTADHLGIPFAPDKLEGPTTRLVFLGILIDSNLVECSLPPDKLSELLAELQAWSSCKKCIKRELLSHIGKLNFACRIIPAGRIFLRRLIDLSTTARLPHHHISLNMEARRVDGPAIATPNISGHLLQYFKQLPAKLATTHSTPQQSWDPSSTRQCRPF